ncbi:hypothetical protein DZF91_32210 [Actinomadura logoneensis]|uniref:Peptidase S26 domain-containing protein n=1 Tax=Actinomadura logoneensis TaxID=2293572 RepID=A0A372JC63_9ACTN|nr:S26 family signal peptidase [Actinomadura logoneensis]RFU37562.1 hypothetical protein DZF91_32210 [Actinomadura logoneensis]
MGRTAPAVWTLGVLASGAAAVLWARRRLVVVTVEGWSMAPTFGDGDRVLVRRRSLADVRPGDVVVLEPPETPDHLSRPPGPPAPARGSGAPTEPDRRDGPDRPEELDGTDWNVKRVVALPGDPIPPGVPGEGGPVPPGRLVVLGDNPDSVDSRQRGLYAGDRLLGVVLRRLGGSGAAGHAPNRQQSPRSVRR